MTRSARRRRQGRAQDGRGSTTVLVLVVVAVLSTLAVAGAAVGGVLVGQRRAAAAADLAALAAAEALAAGRGSAVAGVAACEEAGRVSDANAARLTGCVVKGLEVGVEVAVDVPTLFGSAWSVPGRARGGPATGSGGLGP